MKLKQLKIQGFGLWSEEEFHFSEGINLIEAPNESGKSTLIQGIFALLFGRNREGYRKKTKAEWFEHFSPWGTNSRYGGSIQYQIGLESYELMRSFIDDDQQLILCRTGEDITDQFVLDQKKERRFLEQQIGLSGELLKRISFINSLTFSGQKTTSSRARNHDRELVERFIQLLEQGEEWDIQGVLQDLKQEIDQIGTLASAGSTPYGQVCRQIESYEKKWKEWQKQKEQIQHQEQQWQLEQKKVEKKAEELKKLEREIAHYEQTKQLEDRQSEQIYQWEKYQLELDKLQRRVDDLTALKLRKAQLQKKVKFPEWQTMDNEEVDHFFYLAQKVENLQTQLTELRVEKKELERQLETKDERTIHQLIHEADEMLIELKEYFQLEQIVQEKLEQEVDETERRKEWEQDVAYLREQNGTHWKRHQEDYLLAVGIILTFASTITGWFNLWIGCSVGLFALLAFGSFGWVYLQKYQDRKEIFDRWKVSSWEELLLMQFDEEEIVESLSPRDCEKRMERIRQQVRKWLARFLSSIPPFDPLHWQQEVESLRHDLLQQQKDFNRQSVELSYLQLQEKRLQSEWNAVDKTCLELRSRLGIEEMHWRDWRKEWQREQKQVVHLSELEKEIRSREEIAQIEGWKRQIHHIRLKMEKIYHTLQGASCYLYPEGDGEVYYEKRKQEYQQKLLVWQEQKDRVATLRGSLDAHVKQLKQNRQIEVVWRQAKEQKKRLEKERASYQLAVEVFEQAREQVHRNIAPRIAPIAMRWITAITNDRYQECKLSPKNGFSLRFREPMTGKYYPVERLSRGTIDQIYFALRLAFVQFYSEQTSPAIHLPLFLDDSFVHFDENRLLQTLQILHQFSKKHQIFLCTCHPRERKLMEVTGIPFQTLSLKRAKSSISS
ncbi:AAA domain-containing protein [Seinonella peptonophila]|uniref:AAA domain-containing protein n=1 Tax=Seinonella peptonophila TaxID=112248 RepID=A0A1M4WBI4_9BACL|nr:AAA family ATPase [Seinonella peptonophila]SHE78631.1 AAA domain-containing protein [Seinonella peptonophila]